MVDVGAGTAVVATTVDGGVGIVLVVVDVVVVDVLVEGDVLVEVDVLVEGVVEPVSTIRWENTGGEAHSTSTRIQLRLAPFPPSVSHLVRFSTPRKPFSTV